MSFITNYKECLDFFQKRDILQTSITKLSKYQKNKQLRREKMMKKMMLAVLAAATVIAMTGCSSFTSAANLNQVKIVPGAQPQDYQAHVHAEVWGVYILSGIPLFSGSTVTPGRCTFFNDTVNVPSAVGMVTKMTRKRLNSDKIYDLQTTTDCSWLIPTGLFWYKSVQVSGNVSR
jgi:hypothetical protein